jgi:hypothetical protein
MPRPCLSLLTRRRVLHYAAVGVCVCRAAMQAIALLAPLIKIFASSGLILPCVFSAATVSLKFVSFWMASAFLPSASFALALASLVTRPVRFFSSLWPKKAAFSVCPLSTSIMAWQSVTGSAWAGEALTHISNERVSPSKSPAPILARTFNGAPWYAMLEANKIARLTPN